MEYKKITREEGKRLMEEESIMLIDVRGRGENREKYFHNSEYIPYTDLYYTDKLPQDKNQGIMVYCSHGWHSRVAAQILLEKGYNKVFDLGGIEG